MSVPPRDLAAHLQPLRVLVEHRVDDVDERLVAVEDAVPARQEIALEPPLAEMLGEDLQHAALGCETLVGRLHLGFPRARRDVEDVAETVRRRLVGAEDAEVVRVPHDDVAHEGAEHAHRFARRGSGRGHLHGVVAKVRQDEVAEELAAVCVRVRAHPSVAHRRESGELVSKPSSLVEELLGPVAPQPLLELAAMICVLAYGGERNLMRAPGALDRLSVHDTRAGPALRSTENQHRPRALALPSPSRAERWIAAMRSRASSSAAARRSCTGPDSSPWKPPDTTSGFHP